MTTPIPEHRPADDPSGWTDERLIAEFKKAMADRHANTERVARLWVAAKRRGLTAIPLHNTSETYWYDYVAAGTMRGGLVDLYSKDFVVLRALSRLSLADQGRVLENEPFEVVDADGRTTTRLPVVSMNAAQVGRLIRNGVIRTAAEQRADLKDAQPKSCPKPAAKADEPEPLRKYTPRVDKATGNLVVNNMAIPVPKVLEALASNRPDKPPPLDLHGDEVTNAGCEVVGVMFWREEAERLAVVARRAGLPTQEMIRKAVNAYLGHFIDGAASDPAVNCQRTANQPQTGAA